MNVRVAGSGHSFTPVALTSGLHLTLAGMKGVKHIDRENRRVTASAGTTINELVRVLKAEGLSMINQGDIDSQAIAALAECGATLGSVPYVEAARTAAAYLLGTHLVDGRLRRTSRTGVVGESAGAVSYTHLDVYKRQSPYLLQHADNPVDWQPWDEAALAEARERDLPILLSIGYAACHWCHVMAHESFEDAAVAAALRGRFVAIKVDREERPDLDAVYMAATVALTGRGGWPMTVLLTPCLLYTSRCV